MASIVTNDLAAASLSANLATPDGAAVIPTLQTQLGIGGTSATEVSIATMNEGLKDFAVPGVTGSPTQTNAQFDNASPVTFGSWDVNKSIFTFNKSIVCSVTAAGIGYMSQSSLGNISNFRMQIFWNTTVIPDPSSPNFSTVNLVVLQTQGSTIRRFSAGDTLRWVIQASANTPGGIVDRKYGSLTILGYQTQTYMSIAAI